MPTNVQKIDSNVTGLRYSEETSIGVANGSAVWYPLEPNSYPNFGGEIKTVARNPINVGRQNKKGVTVDLDSSAGFAQDFTQLNSADLLQGLFFADHRRKIESGFSCDSITAGALTANVAIGAVTSIAAGTYTTSGTGFDKFKYSAADGLDLIFAAGFGLAANNGFKALSATTTSTTVTAASLNNSETVFGTIKVVGFQFPSAGCTITKSGAFPVLTRTGGSKNLLDLNLIPGEWVYIGGDTPGAIGAAGNAWGNLTNNGWKRVKSVTSTTITFDKSAAGTMITEAAGTKTIQIFVGRLLKNENNTVAAHPIKRRTYQLERTLGVPDTTLPTNVQSEYVTGSVFNELTLNIPTAEKITIDAAFTGINNEQRTGVQGVKAGTRPSLAESSAFTTSSDVRRIALWQTDTINEAPTALFTYVTDLKIMVKNGASPNKAVSVLGAFEVSIGNFSVEASLTAYFNDVVAVSAVRNNVDVSLDISFVKSNAGVVFDIPMISLGDGRVKVEQDQPATVPLSVNAATGAKYDANMDHTLLMGFYDYLPTLANTTV